MVKDANNFFFSDPEDYIRIVQRDFDKDDKLIDSGEVFHPATYTTSIDKKGVKTKTETYDIPKVVRSEYDIYLLDRIDGSKSTYVKLFNLLRVAKKQDTLTMYLSCYGGDVHAGVTIINAIKDCVTDVHMVAEGPLYSMAPIIALAGKSLTVRDHVFFMFHNYHGGASGSGHEMEAQIKNFGTFMKSLFAKECKPLLTQTEINKIVKGEDTYIQYPELVARLKKHNKKYGKK